MGMSQKGQLTKQKLERIALALFVEKGVNATTIKDIATKAQIAEGTMYRHYKSKEELAAQLFLDSYKTFATDIAKIASVEPTFRGKIRAMTHYFCKHYDEDPVLFSYLLLSQHSQLKYINPEDHSAHKLMVGMLQQAIEKSEIPAESPSFYAAVILGIVLQAAVYRVYGHIKTPMIEDADKLCDTVLRALKIY